MSRAPAGRAPLSIVVDACLVPGVSGGIEQATCSLVAALGRQPDSTEEYIVLTHPDAPNWLDPWVGPNTRVIPRPRDSLIHRGAKQIVGRLPAADWPIRRVRRRLRRSGSVGPPDPFVEGLRPDVVHFPYQRLHSTSAPSLFNPWDLLHMHHPEFFSDAVLRIRADLFPAWCRAATAIEVPSQRTAHDLAHLLRVPREKIYIVRRAAPTVLGPPLGAGALVRTSQMYSLPKSFMYYPAQSWPHKNHVRLLRALRLARERHGLTMDLVCTGRANEHWPTVAAEIKNLGLQEYVHWLGHVPAEHVRALYRLSDFTVFPTLFEGSGLPALEALAEGSALACSNIPVLREQVGEEADLFDPTSVESIASSLVRVATGRGRVPGRSVAQRQQDALTKWTQSARTYRALYRCLARVDLDPDDKAAVAAARYADQVSSEGGDPR